MDKQWTLHIKNFEKINEAEITISPLMCFMGDNNSEKSYLMSLLWGVLILGKNIFPKIPSETKAYKRCENWLRETKNKDIELTDEIINMYISWFNELLFNNKKVLLKKIFNYNVEAEKIEIKNYKRNNKIEIKWENCIEKYIVSQTCLKFPKQETYTKEQLLKMNAYICWNILMYGIAEPLYTPIVKGKRIGEPVYIPTPRTGFMLTYPQLIENSLQVSYSPTMGENTSALTLPYIDFLQLITKFETKNKLSKKNEAVVRFIEENMTKGNVFTKKDMIPVIKYRPYGIIKEIPLYLTSSIVTEITPLLLLFKSDINFKTLMIEEPEAHLHPELQQVIARLIINIVNLGIPVWITTHSDTILQHINNMIKLKNHPQCNELMNEYSYNKIDLLDSKDVSMYQFIHDKSNKTKVTKLEYNKYGFVVPTFNDTLDKIVQETFAFQDD